MRGRRERRRRGSVGGRRRRRRVEEVGREGRVEEWRGRRRRKGCWLEDALGHNRGGGRDLFFKFILAFLLLVIVVFQRSIQLCEEFAVGRNRRLHRLMEKSINRIYYF